MHVGWALDHCSGVGVGRSSGDASVSLGLAVEPSITRQILIGAILIVMMNARPQGLLGKRRVEVV